MMTRKNLAGEHWGQSQRLTIRLTKADLRTLDQLTLAWTLDRSETLRRILREAGQAHREQIRDELLATLPQLSLDALRALARQRRIAGRSKMTKAALRDALRAHIS